MLQARESRIDERIKKMEKKQADYEKKKRAERRDALGRIKEKQEEWKEKRQRVLDANRELEDKSVSDYRKAVKA